VCGKRLPARPPRDYLTTATTTEVGPLWPVTPSDSAMRGRDTASALGERTRDRADVLRSDSLMYDTVSLAFGAIVLLLISPANF
jgi:hypothetical protein